MKANTDSLREQLEEFALHIKPGSTKGRHRTAIFDTVDLTKLVEALIKTKQLELLERVEKELPSIEDEEEYDKHTVNGWYLASGSNKAINQVRKSLDTLKKEIKEKDV